jgi:hypothetical protein
MHDPEDVSAIPLRRLAQVSRAAAPEACLGKLQVEGQIRELAMFNLAIDSKLRGCDVVALKIEDVARNGYAVDRATVRQKKTGSPSNSNCQSKPGMQLTTT